MKGVILGINPNAQLVDISHRISPQNVFEAAFLLSTVYRCFPRSAVHLVVVDPGVGTTRKIIVLKTPDGAFVAPDNGVLSYVLRDYAKDNGEAHNGGLKNVTLTGEARAVEVTNSHFFRLPVSDTFHGRDIMAPVAAMLSQGFNMTAFGAAAGQMLMLDLPGPEKLRDGTLISHALYFDSFGNIITDLRAGDLPPGELRVETGKHAVTGLKRTYAEGSGLMAVIGSSGYLEIALRGGSAAAMTELRIGDAIKIRAGA